MLASIRERAKRIADHSDGRPTFKTVVKRIDEALRLAEKIQTSAKDVRENVMIPVEGRRKQLQDGTTANVKAVQALENAIADEVRMLANERRARERLPTTPSDPVSIQIRAELRAHLRAMTSAQRLEAARIENLDATTLEAILEVPPSLSGLPPAIVDHIRSQIVATKGVPDFSAVDNEVAALTKIAVDVARQSAAGASEMEAHVFAARVAGVRTEMTVAIDRSDADLPTLLSIAAAEHRSE